MSYPMNYTSIFPARRLFLCVFLSLVVAVAFSPPALGLEGSWQYHSPLGSVNDLTVREGVVWCATTGGILRLDTHTGAWTTIQKANGLPDFGVTSLHIDRTGTLWAGVEDGGGRGIGVPLVTGFGICRCDNGVWTVCRREKSLIRDITESPDGTLWFATGSGLVRFDGETWEVLTSENSGLASTSIGQVFSGPDGSLWVAYSLFSKGLTRFDGRVWTTHALTDSATTSQSTSALAVDREGVVWIGTDIGVVTYDGDGWKEHSFGRFVTSIAFDENDAAWCTVNGGVWRYGAGEWTQFTTENSGLAGNGLRSCFHEGGTVYYALEDKKGISICAFDGSVWNTWRPDSRYFCPHAYSGPLFARDGTSWLGNRNGGLLRYDGSQWRAVDTGLTETTNSVWKIVEDHAGVLWTIGYYGAASFDGSRWTGYRGILGLLNGGIRDILTDRNGNTWWVTEDAGLYRFDGVSAIKFDTGNTPLGSRFISDIAEDLGGSIWVATHGAGANLCSYHNGEWKYCEFPDSGASDLPVMKIAVDHENVKWLLTRSGRLWSYNGENWTSYETAKKAQPVDWYTGYYNIVVDNRNRKWVAVNGDWLGCLDGSVWTTYTVENGSLPFIIKRLLVDSRGRAWITSPISKYLAVLEGSSWTVFDRENSPLGPFDVFNISEGPDHSIWFISIKDIVRFIPRESSTGAERENTPNAFLTLHNHPNPFNPITTISFTLPRPGKTSLIVYDITGRKVRELISGVMSAGEYSVTWDGKDEDGKAVSSGLYIAYIESGGRAQSRKMQLMK